MAFNMPSMPRLPKPPGTRMPSKLGLVVAVGLGGCVADGFVVSLQSLGLDPCDLELEVAGERAVDEGFLEGFVAVFVLDVLADDGDGDLVLRVVGAADDLLPAGEVGGLGVDAEVLEDEGVDVFGGQR
jgi:hypothetical protein